MRFPIPSQEMLDRARQMWDEGLSGYKIGRACGKSDTWAYNQARRYGWPQRWKRTTGNPLMRCPVCLAKHLKNKGHLCHGDSGVWMPYGKCA